jgi:hypothetical protein
LISSSQQGCPPGGLELDVTLKIQHQVTTCSLQVDRHLAGHLADALAQVRELRVAHEEPASRGACPFSSRRAPGWWACPRAD